jgi:hypothetical protein
MSTRFLLLSTLPLVLAAAASAQMAAPPNMLTNHDILVLAQAGFNENFIADFIAMSRTRFDTSVAGLAELAKDGLNERLIRLMLAASVPPQPASTAPASASTAPLAAQPAFLTPMVPRPWRRSA